MIDAKVAVILGTAAVLCTALYLYYSPFQQCVRELRDDGQAGFEDTRNEAAVCLSRMGSR